MNIVRLMAVFFSIELLLILGVLVLTGALSADGIPMKFFTDLAASNGTTVWDMATAFFVVGSLGNVVFMFLMAAFGSRS